MSNSRKYNYQDVDTILACKTITTNFITNLSELSAVRTNWTPEYANGLSDRIDYSMDEHLGLDKKKELRQASAKLAELQIPAMRDISFLKKMIEVDFKTEASDILKSLGYNIKFREVQQGNQEALIQMLFAFNKGMTDNLKEQIVEKGTTPELIERIKGYAKEITNANITQETLKETTKDISAEALKAFNDIYTEVIGICKIAQDFYRFEPLKKEQFTFSKVVENMGISRKLSEGNA